VVAALVTGHITPCYDGRILAEYYEVLTRPIFGFEPSEVHCLLAMIRENGEAVSALPGPPLSPDPDDTPFYEVARTAACPLITGNRRHFPDDPWIYAPGEFMAGLTGRPPAGHSP
jgi:hypothetical protein